MTGMAAIVLAGGRGSRMGGIAKPLLQLGGSTLLGRAVDAARAVGCDAIVVVGPPVEGVSGVRWAREDPPFGGPVSALAAALELVTADWVLVLPADLVSPRDAARALTGAGRDGDGVCLVDDQGREQWLTGIYRTAALGERLATFVDGVEGLPARRLVHGLRVGRIEAGAAAAADVDTWDHLREARRRVAAGTETTMADSSSRTLPPEALDAWAAVLRDRFDLSEDDLPISLILDLARDVANGVARPAAPFSAYVAGLVAGRAGGSPEQVRAAVAEITRLAAEHGDE